MFGRRSVQNTKHDSQTMKFQIAIPRSEQLEAVEKLQNEGLKKGQRPGFGSKATNKTVDNSGPSGGAGIIVDNNIANQVNAGASTSGSVNSQCVPPSVVNGNEGDKQVQCPDFTLVFNAAHKLKGNIQEFLMRNPDIPNSSWQIRKKLAFRVLKIGQTAGEYLDFIENNSQLVDKKVPWPKFTKEKLQQISDAVLQLPQESNELLQSWQINQALLEIVFDKNESNTVPVNLKELANKNQEVTLLDSDTERSETLEPVEFENMVQRPLQDKINSLEGISGKLKDTKITGMTNRSDTSEQSYPRQTEIQIEDNFCQERPGIVYNSYLVDKTKMGGIPFKKPSASIEEIKYLAGQLPANWDYPKTEKRLPKGVGDYITKLKTTGELSKFSGRGTPQFSDWYKQFFHAVHSMPDYQCPKYTKVTAIVQYTTGRAAEVVKSEMAITGPDQYERIMSALLACFGMGSRDATTVRTELIKVKPKSRRTEHVFEAKHLVSVLIGELISMGESEEITYTLGIDTLLTMVDRNTMTKFLQERGYPLHGQKSFFKDNPKLHYLDFSRWMSTSIPDDEDELEDIVNDSSIMFTAKTKVNTETNKKQRDSNKKFSCKFCGTHNFRDCTLTPSAKLRKACSLGLCTTCLSEDHQTEKCTKELKCRRCGEDHHIAFCPIKDKGKIQKSEEDTDRNASSGRQSKTKNRSDTSSYENNTPSRPLMWPSFPQMAMPFVNPLQAIAQLSMLSQVPQFAQMTQMPQLSNMWSCFGPNMFTGLEHGSKPTIAEPINDRRVSNTEPPSKRVKLMNIKTEEANQTDKQQETDEREEDSSKDSTSNGSVSQEDC